MLANSFACSPLCGNEKRVKVGSKSWQSYMYDPYSQIEGTCQQYVNFLPFLVSFHSRYEVFFRNTMRFRS